MRYRGPLPKIIYYIIIIVLLAMLAALFLAERKQSLEDSAYYRQRAKDEEQINLEDLNEPDSQADEDDPNDQTTDSDEETEKIFNTLQTAIKKSIPGIICWGNEAMAGSSTGSLPETFLRTLNDNLFKTVKADLSARSSLPDIDGLDIPVVNMGVSQEGLHEILVRTGVHPLILGEKYTIAATAEKKDIVLCDEDGNALRFAKKELEKFGKVTIGEIDGHFYAGSVSYDDSHSRLAFARDAEGNEVTAEEGSIIHTEGSDMYRDHLPIFFFKEQEDDDIEELIQGIRDTVSLYGKKKYVVIASTSSGSNWDEELSQAFKKHYIRSEIVSSDMGKDDYTLLADQVYENLKTQGAFDKVLNAVNEAETSMEAIKSTD